MFIKYLLCTSTTIVLHYVSLIYLWRLQGLVITITLTTKAFIENLFHASYYTHYLNSEIRPLEHLVTTDTSSISCLQLLLNLELCLVIIFNLLLIIKMLILQNASTTSFEWSYTCVTKLQHSSEASCKYQSYDFWVLHAFACKKIFITTILWGRYSDYSCFTDKEIEALQIRKKWKLIYPKSFS